MEDPEIPIEILEVGAILGHRNEPVKQCTLTNLPGATTHRDNVNGPTSFKLTQCI